MPTEDPFVFWRGIPSEVWLGIRDTLLLVVALLAGSRIGAAAARSLVRAGFDSLFHFPWRPLGKTDQQRVKLSSIVGIVLQGTVWLLGVAALCWLHEFDLVTRWLGIVATNVWVIGTVVLLGLAASRGLAAAVVRVLDNQSIRERFDRLFPARPDQECFSDSLARIGGMSVYAIILLPVLLVVADVGEWTAAGEAVAALWQFGLQCTAAGLILLLGWSVHNWLQKQAEDSSEQQRKTDMIFLGGTTLLSALILAGGFNALSAIVVLAGIGVAVWAARGYLPDVWAGAYLLFKLPEYVYVGGQRARILEISLLASDVELDGQELSIRNRRIFEGLFEEDHEEPDLERPMLARDVQHLST